MQGLVLLLVECRLLAQRATKKQAMYIDGVVQDCIAPVR